MRFLFCILFFSTTVILQATHLIGGEITYSCLGSSQYEIKVTIYRDCGPTNSNGTGFDGEGVITIYTGDNNFYSELDHGIAYETIVEDTFTDECLSIPPELCVEKGVYTVVTTLPPNSQGYKIVYQRCCRNEQVMNILNPEDFGSSLVGYIPSLLDASCNSSPQFSMHPPLALCMGSEIEIDQSAFDADGDSLVYSFVAPYHGASEFDPLLTSPPPYTPVLWETGYSDIYPIDSSPTISVNSETGIITGVPTQEGFYVFGIKVEEYRNGIYLGEIIRDFRFLVVDCEIATSSVPIADIYCEGLVVDFENNSENAYEYVWDFGDVTSVEDYSNEFEPSYVYPDSGTYQVTLIANPDSYCSDTAQVEFSLHPDLYPWFVLPEIICEEDALYDFVGDGVIPPDASFLWDFGYNAVEQFSTDLNPNGVSFTNAGIQEISFSVSYLDCDETYSASLLTAGEDLLGINISDNVVCEPDEVVLSAITSSPISDLNFEWDLGNGMVVNDVSPTVGYDAGTYDVSLFVVNTETGCESSVEELDWITVYPQPISIFNADQISGCVPLEVNFENLSENADAFAWYSNGEFIGNEANLSYTFNEGVYEVSLQAMSEVECAQDDFSSIEIVSMPEVIADFEVVYDCNENLEIQLQNTSVEYLFHTWSFGDGQFTNNEIATYQFEEEGNYAINLVVENENSCNESDSLTIPITVALPPEVDFGVVVYEDCQEGVIQFDNYSMLSNFDEVSSWEWSYGDGSSSGNFEGSHTYNEEGVYQVELNVETELGCEVNHEEIVEVNFLQNPIPAFTYSIDTCTHELMLYNESSFADEYIWDFGNSIMSFEESPTYGLQVGSDFEVVLTASNAYCSNSISELISYSINEVYNNVSIPNVFTPNGDYENDQLEISGIRDCESATLRIYNRWGKEVYYSIYPMVDFWDGMHHSEEVVEGVYFYVLELDYYSFKGSVTIFR